MIQTRPELIGSVGMASSTHWLASASAMSVLERGGNAVDAAVAAGFVMQVVEPHLSGPAGDLVATLWSADDGEASVVCGQGTAPAAATTDRFRALDLDLVPGSGLLAATVPGAFGGWTLMLERWGTWELPDVLSYALHYAEQGFPVLPGTAAAVTAVADLFTEHWTPSADVWLRAGDGPAAGQTWTLPAMARTYRRLLQEAVGGTRVQRIRSARQAWYDGFVAEAIDAFCQTSWRDGSGRDHPGLLNGADLAAWQPTTEAPVSTVFGGRYEVLKAGPWSQGPVLGQQLLLFEAAGLPSMQPRSEEWVHTVVECAKLAYADRDAWYGDAADDDVPLETLLSSEYAASRVRLIGADASLLLRPGSPQGRTPVLADLPDLDAAAAHDGTTGEPTVGRLGASRGDTCHVDVVDRWGNLVSATPSGGWLQSSPVVPELGFPLGTRAQMFYLQPGLPNSLRPGARPRTTLSPSLAMRDGEPWLAFGTPGGDQQDQWQATLFADVVHRDLRGNANLQAAIDAPMFHTTHFPSSFHPRDAHPGQVVLEDRLGPVTIDALRARGHEVLASGAWTVGRLTAVAKEGAWLRAAANPRGAQGYAAGR